MKRERKKERLIIKSTQRGYAGTYKLDQVHRLVLMSVIHLLRLLCNITILETITLQRNYFGFKKMLVTIFAFAFLTVHAAAEIPSYIHVCGRRDPNLDQCIANNIDNLKDKLCEGIPELGVPPGNLFTFDEIVISDTPNFKIYIRDAKVTGICDFVVNFLHTDLDTLHFDMELLFKQIQVNTTYDFSIRLLVPITYKGLVYITVDNVEAKAEMDMKLTIKDSKRYIYISKLKLNIDLKKYNAEFDLNKMELGQFYEIINNLFGNNQEEIIKILKPVLEETISKHIVLISNDIVKHFTFEELFPDRT